MHLLFLRLLMACDTPPSEEASAPSRPGLLSPGDFQEGATTAAAPIEAAPPAESSARPTGPVLEGTVLEALSAPPYSYARLSTANGEIWAATAGAAPGVGARVSVSLSLPMRDFHSDSLNRDFALVYFVESLGDPADPQSTSEAAAPTPTASSPGASPPAAIGPAGTGPVRSVASVWADRAALNGETITVRGRVVKYTAGVMGRNWIHIKDGTGQAGSDDLTVTTTATTSMGALVEASGLVKVDEDYGSGYSYPVILTESTLQAVSP